MYSSLIEGTLFDITGGSSQPQLRRPIPNRCKRTAYREMFSVLGYLGLYMDVTPKISFHTAVTDWFPKQSLLYRFVWLVFHPPCHVYPNITTTFVRYVHRILIIQIARWLCRALQVLRRVDPDRRREHRFTGYGPSGAATWNGAANVDTTSTC
jgi:lysophospholipid acyltransferase